MGPFAVRWRGVPAYVVPIQPQYQSMLFPDASEGQLALMPGRYAYGNAIRKAYLCNSPIRRLRPGDNLLFYRSGSRRGIFCLGVAEGTLVSSDADEIARFVGKRTVYSYAEIRRMCTKPVLAILFRQARMIESTVGAAELVGNGVLTSAPQSIVAVKPEGHEWLMHRVGL